MSTPKGDLAFFKVMKLEKEFKALKLNYDEYERGYQDCRADYKIELEDFDDRLKALEALLSANYRVIKQAIEEEITQQIRRENIQEVTAVEGSSSV